MNERGLIKMSEKNEKYYVGQTVTGTVTGVNSNAIYLEIEEGVKAVIYANDLLEVPGKLYLEYSEGAEYTAQVKSIGKDKKNPNVVVLYLSTKLAYEKAQAEAKEKALQEKIAQFHAIKEADEVINAKVLRTTKNGAELTYNNTKLFLVALVIALLTSIISTINVDCPLTISSLAPILVNIWSKIGISQDLQGTKHPI